MSTHNFQFELEDRSYAVQVTPFDQEGRQCHRIQYNDSSSIVFCINPDNGCYEVSGNGSENVTEILKQEFLMCIRKVNQAQTEEQQSAKLSTTVSTDIAATAATVWHTLTTPELVKQYLMGTHVTTDWKEGSPITYEGHYNGKDYRDKGVIKKVIPGKLLQSTYWSSVGGKEDKPENYNLVTYTLSEHEGRTRLELTQDNILSEAEKDHVTKNWEQVLQGLKRTAESI